MKYIALYLAITLCSVGCNKEIEKAESNKQAEVDVVNNQIDVARKEIKRELDDISLKLKKRDLIREKYDLVLDKINYLLERGIAPPGELVSTLERMSNTCDFGTSNLKDVSIKDLEVCEKFLDINNERMASRYGI